MISSICTLYEGHYHYGVGALTNSLYACNFRGSIYVGYKGTLPPWALSSIDNEKLNWVGGKTLSVAKGLELHFLPLTTDYHLTNYKPDFMLQLWEGPAKDAEGMFYFDPDIICNCSFSYLKEWIACGVALSEDINSPLHEFDPKREGWRRYYKKYNINLRFKSEIYVNGGFIGLHKNDIIFLKNWKKLQELMGEEIGGLKYSAFKSNFQITKLQSEHLSIFSKTDQDALNATIENFDNKISFAGKGTMGFGEGFALIPHALGHNKPWLLNPFITFLKGDKIRLVDKLYWSMVNAPIRLYSKITVDIQQLLLKLAVFFNRFYSK